MRYGLGILCVLSLFVWVHASVSWEAWEDMSFSECHELRAAKTIRGHSMEPLLQDGTEVFTRMGYYACHVPARGDIVIARLAHDHDPIIKQIKAIPGDTLVVVPADTTDVFYLEINEQRVSNSTGKPYVFDTARADMLRLYSRDYQGSLPEGAYLILGDQPFGTLDSTRFGLIDRENLLGKVERP